MGATVSTTDRPSLSVDELLTTTRAVRKRLELGRDVAPELIRECLELALQAPTASNMQDWHWVVVTDPDQRAAIATHYRAAYERYSASSNFAGALFADTDREPTQRRVGSSADHLAEHLHEVPALLIPCIARKAGATVQAQAGLYGSILPAVWSFMLAARSRGLGTAWTTLHLAFDREVAEIVGIPHDEVTQTALIPIAHYTGESFATASRQPLDDVLHWDRW